MSCKPSPSWSRTQNHDVQPGDKLGLRLELGTAEEVGDIGGDGVREAAMDAVLVTDAVDDTELPAILERVAATDNDGVNDRVAATLEVAVAVFEVVGALLRVVEPVTVPVGAGVRVRLRVTAGDPVGDPVTVALAVGLGEAGMGSTFL
jgi:hypothetical protein